LLIDEEFGLGTIGEGFSFFQENKNGEEILGTVGDAWYFSEFAAKRHDFPTASSHKQVFQKRYFTHKQNLVCANSIYQSIMHLRGDYFLFVLWVPIIARTN